MTFNINICIEKSLYNKELQNYCTNDPLTSYILKKKRVIFILKSAKDCVNGFLYEISRFKLFKKLN